ncbi:hypothetical protein SAMN05446037_100630 [Anaerovirgula multivorans]|uniref:Uncharacterized protein n=1 Tax=Anaerovirgula multivorans TaxID=312168 RepID=A0A239CLV5_9FIRM|nr:hypothetical protein [Anaerovirgula multivorans]SNS20872.1 hypothetical protein SAMN05446037_100630 [Anaerovirgula multivorans]
MDVRRSSQRQEKRITRSLKQIKEDARTTPGSGNQYYCKSDVVSEHFRVEAKTKVKDSKSITIKREWLDKIAVEAFETNKTPALAFSFGDGTDYMVLRDRDFYTMVEKLHGGEADG